MDALADVAFPLGGAFVVFEKIAPGKTTMKTTKKIDSHRFQQRQYIITSFRILNDVAYS